MASLRTQVFLKTIQSIPAKCSPFLMITRGTAVPPRRKPKRGTIKHRHLVSSTAESLAAKGFLRSHKHYTPNENVADTIQELCQQVLPEGHDGSTFLSREEKFKLLKLCFEEIQHDVPNSLLYTIRTKNDILAFYETPVSTTTPWDDLQQQELPPNLHLQPDYVRFHPDTDTKFGGITAFPTSSTVVTGLKYKEKYKGHSQKPPFYYDTWSKYIKE